MSNAIEFSEEQAMLLETAMDFCSNKSAMSKVRKSIEDPTGFDQAQWQEMTGLAPLQGLTRETSRAAHRSGWFGAMISGARSMSFPHENRMTNPIESLR